MQKLTFSYSGISEMTFDIPFQNYDVIISLCPEF